jgi:hypothetical protein
VLICGSQCSDSHKSLLKLIEVENLGKILINEVVVLLIGDRGLNLFVAFSHYVPKDLNYIVWLKQGRNDKLLICELDKLSHIH